MVGMDVTEAWGRALSRSHTGVERRAYARRTVEWPRAKFLYNVDALIP